MNGPARLLWKAEEESRKRDKPQGALRLMTGWAMGIVALGAIESAYNLGWTLRGPFDPGELPLAWRFLSTVYGLPVLLVASVFCAKPGRIARLELAPLSKKRRLGLGALVASYRYGPPLAPALLLPWTICLLSPGSPAQNLSFAAALSLSFVTVGWSLGRALCLARAVYEWLSRRQAKPSASWPMSALGLRLAGLMGLAFSRPRVFLIADKSAYGLSFMAGFFGKTLPIKQASLSLNQLIWVAAGACAAGILATLEVKLIAKMPRYHGDSAGHGVSKASKKSVRKPKIAIDHVAMLMPLIRSKRRLAADSAVAAACAVFMLAQRAPDALFLATASAIMLLAAGRAIAFLWSSGPARQRLSLAGDPRIELRYFLCAILAGLSRALPLALASLVG